MADRSTGGVRHSGRVGSGALVTYRPAPVRCGPWPPRLPPVLPAREYRLALREVSVPTPHVIMQAVFPWRQGTRCGEVLASVKFSQPERLPIIFPSDKVPDGVVTGITPEEIQVALKSSQHEGHIFPVLIACVDYQFS